MTDIMVISAVRCRERHAGAKGEEPPDCDTRKEGAAAKKPRAPFRPGGNAPVRRVRASALVCCSHPLNSPACLAE